METPRILAIDDVHMRASSVASDDLIAFYNNLIGLDYVQDNSDEKCLTFRGFPRSGPRLIINLNDDAISTACYRSILIQMACLAQCAELMAEQRQPFSRPQGWFFYDRRLTTYDPAGHLIELVAYHQF